MDRDIHLTDRELSIEMLDKVGRNNYPLRPLSAKVWIYSTIKRVSFCRSVEAK